MHVHISLATLHVSVSVLIFRRTLLGYYAECTYYNRYERCKVHHTNKCSDIHTLTVN